MSRDDDPILDSGDIIDAGYARESYDLPGCLEVCELNWSVGPEGLILSLHGGRRGALLPFGPVITLPWERLEGWVREHESEAWLASEAGREADPGRSWGLLGEGLSQERVERAERGWLREDRGPTPGA